MTGVAHYMFYQPLKEGMPWPPPEDPDGVGVILMATGGGLLTISMLVLAVYITRCALAHNSPVRVCATSPLH